MCMHDKLMHLSVPYVYAR